ncbi:MAG: hypothetical protein HYT87_04315 [Nitrospirae bacterium]|nr:hypothetical protein [Nitrospirota bacterium]
MNINTGSVAAMSMEFEAVTLPLYPRLAIAPSRPKPFSTKDLMALKRETPPAPEGILDKVFSSLDRLFAPSPL